MTKSDKKIKLLLLVIFLSFTLQSYSQESSNSGSDVITTPNGSMSYSVGQVFTYTSTDGKNSEHQGIQQAYEINILTSIRRGKNIDVTFSAYPNPTHNMLVLSINGMKSNGFIYELVNINGTVLLTNNIVDKQTQIDLTSFEQGAYILKVQKGNRVFKTLKILKH